ncbi:MAG: tetratricopeptide repeat protein, partial [Bacteroidia bacterium]
MKLLFLFLGIIAGQVISVAQNHAVDSLLISLKSAQDDTSRVKTLNVLSFEFRKQGDNEKALQYATEALLKANDGLKQFSSIDKMGSQQIQGNKLLYALLKGKAASFNSIGFVYSGKGEYEMAIKSFSSALQIMEQSGNRKGLASSNSNIANIHKIQGHYDEALSYYLKSLDISEHAGDKAGVAGTCISIGDIHASKGDYEKALGFHLKAVKLVPTGTEYTLQWKRIAADAFMNLGNVDYYKSDFDNALTYYLKALNIQKELGNQKRLGDCYNNAANIYYIKNNYDKALEFYYEALKIMEETHSTQGLAYCYNNIGNIYLSKKDDVKALPFFTQSLELMIKIDDKQGAGVCYGNIAMVYLRTNKKAQAKEYQLKSLAIAKEIGAKEDISTAFLGLASADSALGNYKDAFSHYKLYTLYKDSIHNSESEKKMMQAVMQHEYDKKEALARAEQEKIESAHKATLAQQTMQR